VEVYDVDEAGKREAFGGLFYGCTRTKIGRQRVTEVFELPIHLINSREKLGGVLLE
jgi:hypothetical protein